jgi:hypothetical protein
MKDILTKKKWFAVAVTGLLLGGAGMAHAHAVRRIENQQTTVFFSDNVSGAGQLAAALTLGAKTATLDIFTATSGLYNSRLSTRCSDNALFTDRRNNRTGTTAGDIARTCPGNTFPLRIEGAIDDL